MRKDRPDPSEIRTTVLIALGCGVFFVWAVTTMFSVFFGRPIDPGIHTIMGIVATGLFGGAFLSDRKNGKNGS